MLMILFALAVWAVLSSAATLLLCAVGRAGRLEDEARARYVGTRAVPAPRQAMDDADALVTV